MSLFRFEVSILPMYWYLLMWSDVPLVGDDVIFNLWKVIEHVLWVSGIG